MNKEELENAIRNANIDYWNNNTPKISDQEYDRYVEQLKQIDPTNTLLSHIGGTKGKYKHNPPMLSLNKAYTKEEVLFWARSLARSEDEMIFVQPKYDGLAGKIENGRLSTRGDGYLGEDITDHKDLVCVEYIQDYNKNPEGCLIRRYKYSKYIGLVEVQTAEEPIYGELLIDHKTFAELFGSGKILKPDGTKYVNPRNTVAGLFNLKDISNIPSCVVTFVPYTSHSFGVRLSRLSSMFDYVINNIKEEFGSKYPMDGIVFKLADKEYFKSVGTTAHHPKGAIAYKFTNTSGIGIVRDIVWQQGKEVLTPVMNLESPILLGNSYVSRATCHNYKFVVESKFKRGQKVKIEKAGDVIPKLVSIVVDPIGEVIQAPTKCPCCGSDVEVVGVDLVCKNSKCPGKIVPRLVFAAKALRIDGIGPSTAELLHSRLHITHLYELIKTNYGYQIAHLPGFTDYSADLLIRNIKQAIGTVTEAEVLTALCIPGIGLELSKKILEKYSYSELIDKYSSGEFQANTLADVIGGIRSVWVYDFFNTNTCLFVNMYEYFKPIPIVKLDYNKKKVCFTGKFDLSRKECEQAVLEKGMQFTDSMSSDVDYLVVSDLNRVSSKTTYAKKHGIPIITYSQFQEVK